MSATIATLTAKVKQVSDTYAVKCDINRDSDWYVLKLQEELGELAAEYLRQSGRGRVRDGGAREARQAMADEAADVFAQFLLFADHNGVDIESALERKWFKYLGQRPPEGAGE